MTHFMYEIKFIFKCTIYIYLHVEFERKINAQHINICSTSQYNAHVH